MDNILADLLSDDENQEFRFDSTVTDAKINELREEFNVAAGFHHSQFPDSTVSFPYPNTPGFFTDSAPFTDVDWSYDGSELDFSSPSWLKRNLRSAQEKTISQLHIRNPEPPNSCNSVPMRNQEAEGLHVNGCERDINNNTLQSSGCEEQNDLNITGNSGLQPNCFEKLDAEFLDVGSQTKATTLAENSAGTKCRNKDDLNPALVQGNEVDSNPIVVKLEQSALPSQPSQNICNAPTSGNQYIWEYGPNEDYGFVEYPNPTSSSLSPPQFSSSAILADTDMTLQNQLAQVLSHVPIEPQKTKINPKRQNKDKISQLTIRERVSDLVSSKFKDLRDRSLLGSRTESFYIKRQDLEETSELCGQSCYLCKRDLAIKPEGSYMVTKNLPTVAVLPCSHAFHDICLERITPQNQAHDPPCIPCAIGGDF